MQDRGDTKLYQNGGIAYVAPSDITTNRNLIDKWKVFIPFLGSGSDVFPHTILGKPFVGEPGSVNTETYLVIGPFSSRKECENVISYIMTQFFRFLVLLKNHHKTQQKSIFIRSYARLLQALD